MQARSLTGNGFMNGCGDWTGMGTATRSWSIFGKYGQSLQHTRSTIILRQFGGAVIDGTPEKYGVKEIVPGFVCMLRLAGLPAVRACLAVCDSISSAFPAGGIEILPDGTAVRLEAPTESQQRILSVLGAVQSVSCIALPMGGLALSGVFYYRIKLKEPIAVLRNGIERIQKHDLDFVMPVHSGDELGQLCAAFDTMREALLRSNQELWRQMEERKRLNAAFSHDLRNPVTVLKGTVKLLRQGTADRQTIDRLERYTWRIEQYVEAMSSIQRLEQMPMRVSECSYSLLRSELEETAKLLAGTCRLSILRRIMELCR